MQAIRYLERRDGGGEWNETQTTFSPPCINRNWGGDRDWRAFCQLHQCPCWKEGGAVETSNTEGPWPKYDPHTLFLLLLSAFISLPVDHSYLNIAKMIEDTRGRLLTTIEACKQTLQAGSTTYSVSPNTAEVIWKVTFSPLLSLSTSPLLTLLHKHAGPAEYSCSELEVSLVRVTTKLPLTLFEDIQKHGDGISLTSHSFLLLSSVLFSH